MLATKNQFDLIHLNALLFLQGLLDGRKITLQVDDAAKEWLGNSGYDPIYGARPLKRVIQRALKAAASSRAPGELIFICATAKPSGWWVNPVPAKVLPYRRPWV